MKRFLIFARDTYYPAGGWGDFIGQTDNKEEAMNLAKANTNSALRRGIWWQVVDTLEEKICAES